MIIKDLRFVTLTALVLSMGENYRAPSPLEFISIDFPHGETRLVIDRKGRAFLYYGALPEHTVIKRGTFHVDALYKQLRTRLHDNVPTEERVGKEFGMVMLEYLDGTQQVYLIYDGKFAKRLFKKARKNVIRKTSSVPIRYPDGFAVVCAPAPALDVSVRHEAGIAFLGL